MTKLEKELYQDLEKNGYLTPYMFPMIGKNYGKKGLKKIVFLAGYVFQDEYVDKLFSPYKGSWSQNDKNNEKQDFMRHAWSNQKVGTRTPQKWFEMQKSGLCEDDMIFATYSRYPSKEKYEKGLRYRKSFGEVLNIGGFDKWHVPYNSLQSLLEIAKPDELWILGPEVKDFISWDPTEKNTECWDNFEKGLNEDNCKLRIIPLRKKRYIQKKGKSYADECIEICKTLSQVLPLNATNTNNDYKIFKKLKCILENLNKTKAGLELLLEETSTKTGKNVDEILKKLDDFCCKMTRKRASNRNSPNHPAA